MNKAREPPVATTGAVARSFGMRTTLAHSARGEATLEPTARVEVPAGLMEMLRVGLTGADRVEIAGLGIFRRFDLGPGVPGRLLRRELYEEVLRELGRRVTIDQRAGS